MRMLHTSDGATKEFLPQSGVLTLGALDIRMLGDSIHHPCLVTVLHLLDIHHPLGILHQDHLRRMDTGLLAHGQEHGRLHRHRPVIGRELQPALDLRMNDPDPEAFEESDGDGKNEGRGQQGNS